MKISEQAAAELKKALDDFNKPGAGVHIFSTQGCCGPSIQMDISTQVGNGETVLSINEIDFFVASDVLPTLENVTIEYGMNGFRLTGLKKSSGCCG